MKRSHINYAVDKAHAIAETFRVCLPDFAYFTIDAWRQQDHTLWREVRDLQLGWDITDFGRGDFAQTGLTLLTLRNGQPGSANYPKPYAEKMLQIQQDQQTPWHFHRHKMEDIVNRGGGDLCMQLAWATPDDGYDARRIVEVSVDGQRHSVKPGETLVLKPGQGVCLPPRTDSSAVITTLDWLSIIRLARLSAENPPNTKECTAPIRAQASIATAASGIIGK